MFTHGFVIRAIKGDSAVGDSPYLRVYIMSLHLTPADTRSQNRIIQTAMGIGYRLADPDSQA